MSKRKNLIVRVKTAQGALGSNDFIGIVFVATLFVNNPKEIRMGRILTKGNGMRGAACKVSHVAVP
jgi:hypothetical protein